MRIGLRIFVVTLAGAGELPLMPFELTGCQGSEQHQNPVFSGFFGRWDVTKDAHFSPTTPFRIRATLG